MTDDQERRIDDTRVFDCTHVRRALPAGVEAIVTHPVQTHGDLSGQLAYLRQLQREQRAAGHSTQATERAVDDIVTDYTRKNRLTGATMHRIDVGRLVDATTRRKLTPTG